jgi:hypothetical protein
MCNTLAVHSVTPKQLDSLATKYWYKGDGDVVSCYNWAYNDLLPQNETSETVKYLYKELDRIADEMIAEDKAQDKSHTKEQNYIVIRKDVSHGIFTATELQEYFIDKDPSDYLVIEAGNMVKLEKKVVTTTTIIIK